MLEGADSMPSTSATVGLTQRLTGPTVVNSAAKLFVVYTVLEMGIEQNPNSISIVFEQNRNERTPSKQRFGSMFGSMQLSLILLW